MTLLLPALFCFLSVSSGFSKEKFSRSPISSSDISAIACVKSDANTAVFGGDSRVCCQSSQGDPGGDIKKLRSASGTLSRKLVGS